MKVNPPHSWLAPPEGWTSSADCAPNPEWPPPPPGWLLWAMLAYRPRRVPAIWEVVIFHKLAVAVFALTILDTSEGMQSAITDSSLRRETGLAA
ncbi:hypothetical protein NONI108955_05855 [Nocardia ninae]|uniref:Uncharacterized protein n=1 Tax=Nocardia ninae NBRC 108245 TaxID=1210091 RepID=A0A511MDV2_9NOCA|nr:hypothetical protein [Nocardia ninae]GEM38833.1 hypothetical protein NN4_33520 [Nocardia ninae NBRC 108245]